MAANPVFPGSLKTGVQRWQNADGTAAKTIVAPGANGAKVDALSFTNTDTSVVTVMQLSVLSGSLNYIVGEVNVPAGAGTNGTVKAVDAFNVSDLPWIRSDGINRYLYLQSGAVLQARAKVAVAGSFAIDAVAQFGDY